MRKQPLQLFILFAIAIVFTLACIVIPVYAISSTHTAGNYAVVTDYSKYYNAAPNSNAKKHIFFSGIPMPGHIFPLLATAEELALRGYTVTISTVSSLEKTVRNHKHPLVNQVSIGECTPLVEEWGRLQVEMNDIVDFGQTSEKIFSWVQKFHPCHFAGLYSNLYRAQLGLDFNPNEPDYTVMPPIDLIVSDIVTHPVQDVAKSLSIRYVLNNPDILQVLPGEAATNWDNTPLLFFEDSLHPFGDGVEVRQYKQQFHFEKQSNLEDNDNNNEEQNAISTILTTNFTNILNLLKSNDPFALPKYHQTNPQPESELISYKSIFYHAYSLGTRFIYSLVRPILGLWLRWTQDKQVIFARHAQAELTLYSHLQLYVKLLRTSKIPGNILSLQTPEERNMVATMLQDYIFDDLTLDKICQDWMDETVQINNKKITLWNQFLIKYYGSEFVLLKPELTCNLYYTHRPDFDKALSILFKPPQNPTKLHNYYQTFIEFFALTSSQYNQQQQQYSQNQPVQYSPLRFSYESYSIPWLRLLFNPFGYKTMSYQAHYTAPFDKSSQYQRHWSFYKSLATFWSGSFDTAGIPVLQGSVFGVEYQRPLPPFVHMVGPLIPESNQGLTTTENTTPATERQLTWLNGNDDDDETNNYDPIIYMSFGTLGHLNKQGTVALFQAYAELIEATKLRVLWKLTSHYVEMVVDCYLESGIYIEGFFDAVEAIPRGSAYLHQIQGKIGHYHQQQNNKKIIPQNRWLFTEWVYSQYGVLEHSNTKVFLSHCGINSAYEAILAKTYIFCIPLFGDQGHMATMLSDRGVGLSLLKQHVNKDTLVSAMKFALAQRTQPEFNLLMNRLKYQIDIAGGKSRAAELVVGYLEYGSDATVEPVGYSRAYFRQDHVDIVNYRYTHQFELGRVGYQDSLALPSQRWYQHLDWDLYLCWYLIIHIVAYLVWKLIKYIFRCCCCSSKQQPTKTVTNTNHSKPINHDNVTKLSTKRKQD